MKNSLYMALIICTAVSILVGCSDKKVERKSDTVSVTEEETEPVTEENTEPDSYAPLATARERDIIEDNDLFDYEIYEGKVIITRYKGSAADVEIPAEIDGAPVEEIGFYAFESKNQILSVILPDSVKKICEGAFMGCSSMYSINIPSGLEEIQRGAFVDCSALTDMTLPAAVKRVQEEAFTGCSGLTSLTIENPDLQYEYWGLEELSALTVYAPEGSAAAAWAETINSQE